MTDAEIDRLGTLSVVPRDMTKILHVRRLGSHLWAVFYSGDLMVRGPLPKGHYLDPEDLASEG